MKPLNILIAVTTGVTGGAQTIVLTLAEELHRRGHRVLLATGGSSLPNTLLPRAQKQGIPIHQFTYLKRTYKLWQLVLFFIEAFRYCRRERFDCIHLHSSHTLFAAPAAYCAHRATKIIFTFHGLSYLDPTHRRKPLTRFLINLTYVTLLPFVRSCIFVSKKNRDDAIRYGLVRHGTVIYNGITPSFLPRNEARAALGLPSEGKIIGSIGRLDYPKNYEFLIRCMLSVPQASLAIIGEGPERKRLEFLIRTAGLTKRCVLLGERDHAAQFIKAFDLFILPSRYEGLSLALIEAVMAGIPVLASRVGGNAEVVDEKDEQLFEVHNVKECVVKAQTILGNADLAERLRNHNQKAGARFTAHEMVTEYESVYSNPKS